MMAIEDRHLTKHDVLFLKATILYLEKQIHGVPSPDELRVVLEITSTSLQNWFREELNK